MRGLFLAEAVLALALSGCGVTGPQNYVSEEGSDEVANVAPSSLAPPVQRTPFGLFVTPEPAVVPISSGADTSPGTLASADAETTEEPVTPAETRAPPAPGVPDRPSISMAPDTRPTSPSTSAGGASIVSFQWLDDDDDVVGGSDQPKPNGEKDQHFRLTLALPPSTIIRELVIISEPHDRWVTQPSNRYWPIAIFQDGKPITRAHVAQIGAFSGRRTFDLYVNTGSGSRPGTPYDLEAVVSTNGARSTLTAHCTRPNRASDEEARGRPGDARNEGNESCELPAIVRLSSGGASITAFEWLDRDEDRVSPNGGQISPGWSKDEHYRLTLDLPHTTVIDEMAITGGGVLRWTTKPGTRFGPLGIFEKGNAAIKAQTHTIGIFGGRRTFDLYVESHGSIKPDNEFGIEVILKVKGVKHILTARCRRH